MIVCAITDRASLRGESLLDAIARNLRAGVTWLQIREKDLSARQLYELVRAAKALPNPSRTRIIGHPKQNRLPAASSVSTSSPR